MPSICLKLEIVPNPVYIGSFYIYIYIYIYTHTHTHTYPYDKVCKLGTVREYPNCQYHYSCTLELLLSKISFLEYKDL